MIQADFVKRLPRGTFYKFILLRLALIVFIEAFRSRLSLNIRSCSDAALSARASILINVWILSQTHRCSRCFNEHLVAVFTIERYMTVFECKFIRLFVISFPFEKFWGRRLGALRDTQMRCSWNCYRRVLYWLKKVAILAVLYLSWLLQIKWKGNFGAFLFILIVPVHCPVQIWSFLLQDFLEGELRIL